MKEISRARTTGELQATATGMIMFRRVIMCQNREKVARGHGNKEVRSGHVIPIIGHGVEGFSLIGRKTSPIFARRGVLQGRIPMSGRVVDSLAGKSGKEIQLARSRCRAARRARRAIVFRFR